MVTDEILALNIIVTHRKVFTISG